MAQDKQTEGLAQGGDEILLGDTAIVTRLDKAIGWARKFSIFPYPFATATPDDSGGDDGDEP